MSKTIRRINKGEGKKPKVTGRKGDRHSQHVELAMLKRR